VAPTSVYLESAHFKEGRLADDGAVPRWLSWW